MFACNSVKLRGLTLMTNDGTPKVVGFKGTDLWLAKESDDFDFACRLFDAFGTMESIEPISVPVRSTIWVESINGNGYYVDYPTLETRLMKGGLL